ncbi:MAG: penicillin acylase family protein, partial [Gemmatimonadaceae bacterium]|nr:penicillin acylase family protein [Gemmatimonadaceae bacterium]
LYAWNGVVPSLPHASGGDSIAIPARTTADVFTRLIPWDSLPHVQNPRGGYVRNENDSPWFTNMRQVLDWTKYPPNMEPLTLRLRSQLSLELIDNERKFSLEEIMALKNSYRMLLADRVKPDLLAAVRASNPSPAVAAAAATLAQWDNTAGHDSRGGVLFQAWWQRYTDGANADTMYAEPWEAQRAATTPRGLRHATRAAEAFAWAVDEVTRRHGRADVAWGDVHRVRHGDVDVPVGGCGGALGCFRVLNFRTDPDGKRSVIGGDGWVIGVEFTDVPRAYSVLAYGQSPDPANRHHDDQAAMFAAGQYKRVLFTERDIEADVIRRYRP